MESNIATMADDILPGRTAIGLAIRRAVADHPSVAGDPASRSRKSAAVTAAAHAMADITRSPRPEDAGQLVDDAALSLNLHGSRTVPVALRFVVTDRHMRLARQFAQMQTGASAGIDVPETIARCEAAVERIRLIHVLPDPALSILPMLLGGIREAVDADVPLSSLDDQELLDVIERAYARHAAGETSPDHSR